MWRRGLLESSVQVGAYLTASYKCKKQPTKKGFTGTYIYITYIYTGNANEISAQFRFRADIRTSDPSY